MNRDNAKERIDQGVEALHEALAEGRSEELENFLAVMGKFHRYSWGNQMLIYYQAPQATRVAGYTRWKELGRQVRRGEHGIGILAPIRRKVVDKDDETQVTVCGFKLAFVFDISQTEGEDLPEFAKASGDPGHYQARIEAVIRNAGIHVVEDELPLSANGCSEGGTITVRPGLEPAERLRVTVHEYAHELLGHSERIHNTTQTLRETEAEAIAFVVTNALGIDGIKRSSDYIQLHGGGVDSLAESLGAIQKTSARILDELEQVQLGCKHTLHLAEGSTWVAVADAAGTKYECSVCGKFYGRTPNSEPVPAPVLDSASQEGGSVDQPPLEQSAEPAKEPEPLRVGRSDYHERREARIDRLTVRADKARSESNATYEQAHTMAEAIPFGQPILVGHHSEGRDRRYRERIRNKMDQSIEQHKKAERIEQRAVAAEQNDAISSDNPDALELLREKLQQLEERQEYMKRLNAAWRKAGKPNSKDLAGWQKVADILGVAHEKMERLGAATSGVDHYSQARDRAPAAPYELSNNNANIRRVKERISALEQEGAVTDSTEVDHGVCRVIENVEINRIQLVFPGKPPEEVRDLVKRAGFRWARSERAWQRQLNNAGRYAAQFVVEQLQKMKGETPDEQSEQLRA